jgi:hypothetical protein
VKSADGSASTAHETATYYHANRESIYQSRFDQLAETLFWTPNETSR